MKLFTIGYEGATIDDFTGTLQRLGVEEIIDIRELPVSRRKGFSKNALRDALTDAGIGYTHERLLGSPRDIRHKLNKDHDYDYYFKAFGEHLKTQHAALERVADTTSNSIALLCYERDYKICHRSVVANALGNIVGVKPKHVGVQNGTQRKTLKEKSMRTGQSVSTAE